MRNGDVSFWYRDIGGLPGKRPALPGDRTADVCIVGAGYTGLWTAYYLKKADPGLDIVILEREFAGFGASGRNGGWLSGGFAWSREKYLSTGSRDGVREMVAAMMGTVEEVIRVCEAEGIDADIVRTDEMRAATSAVQWERIQKDFAAEKAWDVPAEDIHLIGAEEARARINIANVHGAMITRGVARVQPAKLVRGLAGAVERLGVTIYEDTAVTGLEKGLVTTARGTVRAPVIIRATEGFTAGLPGLSRTWLPLNSAQIVTEPLSEALWREIGWNGHEILGDGAHAYCYAQRTREGRIAMGGRGVPYRFGSQTDVNGQTQPETIRQLTEILHRHFPQTKGARIDHAWCGVLGVPRDWCATVGLDPDTGIGWAGGYVGVGVSTSNLSGRTLSDLVLRKDTALTRLPWVNRKVRPWEPEPLRWLGVHTMYRLFHMADRQEARPGAGPSGLARFANALTGR
ncbi:NAD(P)/FAD-dependent oxidoreductase [Gellertiella hungarica]|uniref:Glycine/D-amino acid oxidase-like deaminating enzyme n=1 Tax=Gellertiella hungarica TaxID=1572859 RepID=A0A7W6NI19_9HYPH|nr:FAD-binding oxidoreductase [Gellertiella hungarica]MBB4062900.1 glycine/D-amino acid oxidase-like deaminating enzyme [Gellertiella hungarica]